MRWAPRPARRCRCAGSRGSSSVRSRSKLGQRRPVLGPALFGRNAERMDEGDPRPIYHRVLLKLSGEAFSPASGSGISDQATALVARQLAEVVDVGIQPAVVVGGGNIWRGRQAPGI